MRRSILVAAAACGLTLTTTGAQAQVPGIDIELLPKIGAHVPLSDLSIDATQQAEVEAGLAIGLGIELDLPLLPINVRANADYATGAKLAGVGTGGEDVDATLLGVGADLIFQPLPLPVVSPYFFAGAGVVRRDFDLGDSPPASLAGLEDTSDFAVHLGAGVDVGLGPLALTAELADYISWYSVPDADETEIQNDLFLMLGFRVGMF